jgi:D-alanyl-D-alanine-carboxypeptidase/D-alanyl-D-alanine-endopeptidase
VYDAASVLKKAGFLKERAVAITADLSNAYRIAGNIYEKGDVSVAGNLLAMNFLMDRDAAGWSQDLAALKKEVGNCNTTTPIEPSNMMSGEFTWRCEFGRVTGHVLLAPTLPPSIQELKLMRKAP